MSLPHTIGPYVVTGSLGQGGMGVSPDGRWLVLTAVSGRHELWALKP